MKVSELFESTPDKIKPRTASGKRAYKDYTTFTGADKKKKGELKKEMDREMVKFKDSDHKAKSSYPEDWTADQKYKAELKKKGKKLPKSKYTDKFHQMYGEDIVLDEGEDVLAEGNVDVALKNKSEKTGIKVSTLRAVLNRGLAAWRQHHRPGVGQIQWAMGRINSFITGGGARKADKDLWDKRNA